MTLDNAVLPPWFRQEIPDPAALAEMRDLLRSSSLHTVCEGANCPNLGYCWGKKTATFMILGDICTRACRFCAVKHGKPSLPETGEPESVAAAVKRLALKHVVITSVTRDDMPDQGAGQFLRTVEMIRKISPGTKIEVLIPDFSGKTELVGQVIESRPDIIGHNIETVWRLYPLVRPQADYMRALNVLADIKRSGFEGIIKSGIMLGLGEIRDEILQTMRDLKDAGCDVLTIGQYLSPSQNARHVPVERFIHPEEFKEYEDVAYGRGFRFVMSGPLVRSSYMAEEVWQKK